MTAEASPTRREARRNSLYEKVMAAAIASFASAGFEGTTIPEVMQRAGVGAGSLYRLFPSKEALFNAAFRDAKGRMARAVEVALTAALLSGARDADDAARARATFDALWDALVAFAAEEPVTFRFLELHHHAAHLDPESQRLERAVLEPLRALVVDFQARGVLRGDVPAEAVIAFVWGALVGLVKAETLGYLRLAGAIAETTRDACFRAFAVPHHDPGARAAKKKRRT